MKSKNKEKIFKLGELFSGPGGLALGAATANLSSKGTKYKIIPTWASDYHEDACETYKKNISKKFNPNELVICENVQNLNIKNLPEIDAFAYGFPCNDYSIVGEQLGFNGNYGPLYSYGVSVLNCFKPKFFVAENVGGLRNANKGDTFKLILRDLAAAGNGYDLTAHLYKFEEYGVPQARHRVIIVGIDKELEIKFKVPAPTAEKPVTASHAINNPPISAAAYNNEATRQSKAVIERLKHIKPGKNAWCADIPVEFRLNVKGAKLSQIYKRLDPKEPAYTITGSGGGGTHVYHWKENRALTNRERARLQTFPDSYNFQGSKESVRRQVGMAVSPLMAKIIFKSILKCFAGVTYRSVSPNLIIDSNVILRDELTCLAK